METKKELKLVHACNGFVAFGFNNMIDYHSFLNKKPDWMRLESYERVLEKIKLGELVLDYVKPFQNFVPDPMPEQRRNNFGAYLAD